MDSKYGRWGRREVGKKCNFHSLPLRDGVGKEAKKEEVLAIRPPTTTMDTQKPKNESFLFYPASPFPSNKKKTFSGAISSSRQLGK